MENKTIAISANVIWTITNFRKELIKFLIKNGYKVVCIADKDELSINLDEQIKTLGISFEQVNVDRKSVNPIKDIKYFLELLKVYKKVRPDLVMHFTIKPNIYGTVAAKLLGIPSINTINGLGSGIIKDNILSKILKMMYRFSLSNSSKIFFQNKEDKKFFLENYLVKEENVSIVPGSGVDVEGFGDCKKEDNGKLIFLLIARLLKDKGVYEYLEAAKMILSRYENVEFLVGGQFDSGNPSAIDKDIITKWENDKIINYIGVTDNIEEFFKRSDIIVLPSYREGLSRVLIEAASCKKVLISSDVPGCNDVVEDEINGFLCKVKDIDSLVEAMEKAILLDQKEFNIFADNSKKIAKDRFDKNIVNKIYFDAINDIVDKKER